ncbi:WD40 repeat-like protein [Martensiomyces pterosporus]|nr:WD40 repeat-like protein [Martensiomyces pterosporus]
MVPNAVALKETNKRRAADGSPDADQRHPKRKPQSQKKRSKVTGKLTWKTREETDLESLVFGGDEDVASDVFSKIGKEVEAFADEPELESESEGEEDVADEKLSDEEEASDEEPAGDDSLFFVDTVRAGSSDEETESDDEGQDEEDVEAEEPTPTSSNEEEQKSEIAAAWVDEDTEMSTVSLKAAKRTRKLRIAEKENKVSGDVYEQRLRQQFQKINPVPKWAEEAEASAWKDDEGSDDDNERIGSDLLRSSKSLMSKAGTLLSPTTLDVTPLRHANHTAPSQRGISSLQFHPTANVVLTAGSDKTLRLFEVDGKENQKIQSIFFKDLPITTAQFIRNGQEIVVSGRRGWYYAVDVERGAVTRVNGIPGHKMSSLERMYGSVTGDRLAVLSNNGQIHLVTARTKQFIHTLPMNGVVRDVSFTADGNYLWSIGLDNEVYQWDLRQNRCLSRWHDPTTFRPTCMGLSQDSSYFASGDNAGIVNIYDATAMRGREDEATGKAFNVNPIKSINNLTTSITDIKFNHNSEIMGIYSRSKPNQFKLVHLPSATVFANWPLMNAKLGKVECFDFSPHSGFLAIGNDNGRALLYKLDHYKTY